MSQYSAHYRDGQEVHAGDVFTDGHEEHLVTVVLDRNEFLPQWESWTETVRSANSSGFLCQSWRSGPIFYNETDEDQVLVRRGVRVADPETTPTDGPFTLMFYDAGATVNRKSLAQDPSALKNMRVVKTSQLPDDSIALHEIQDVVQRKAGYWQYTNYCIIPVMAIEAGNQKIGFQEGWIIAHVFDWPRQFVAPLTKEEYQKITKAVEDGLHSNGQ